MKKIKKCLSIILAFVMLLLSTVSVVAETSDESLPLENKCSQKVIEFLKGESDLASSQVYSDERLPVYIWYKDINQDYVDTITEEVTGLSAEECSKIDDIYHSSLNYKSVDFSKTDEEILAEYIDSTSELREIEKANVERYTMARREIAAQMYEEKSNTLIDSIEIDKQFVDFNSQYAPLIIANLSVSEIERARKLNSVELICYYEETECIEPTIESALSITNVDDVCSDTLFGLSGDGVKVGLIENYRVSFYEELAGTQLYGEYGIVPEVDNSTNYYTPNGVFMKDYGNVVVVGNSQRKTITQDADGNDIIPHADKTSKTLLAVAPEIKLYTSNWQYNNIEAMIHDGVSILTMSLSWCVLETADDYAYTLRERWMDHLAANHGVTMLVAAGNDGKRTGDEYVYNSEEGKYEWLFGPRVTSPALAYNVISVGAYSEHSSDDDHNIYDSLQSYSSYRNFVMDEDGVKKYGCEKPDVVSPSNFNGGGTSNSTPFLAGTIALMFELKPALANFPQEIKAIVLASCHRKVNQTTEQGGAETMYSGIPGRQNSSSQSGITERQGAGAPDAWLMACIICQGSYGSGVVKSTDTIINIEQPPYGANYMNVSLSFIKENVPLNGHTEAQIQEGVTNNLDLLVYQNDTVLRESALWVSSTEMCYVPLSSDDFKYKFKIKQNITGENTRFGYAWSTNIMRMSPAPTELDKITEGIYHIKNKANERYITYNSSAQSEAEYAKLGFSSSISQSKLTDSYRWIVKSLGNGYNVETGYGIESKYLGIGSQQSSDYLSSKVTVNADSIIIEKNSDGSYSIFNSFRNKILTYDSSRCLVWCSYTNDREISNNERWYFEKCNFLKGDTNIDGEITSSDASYVQTSLAGITVQNNIERYLSDVDRDGDVSILDVNIISNMVNSIYAY